MRARTDDVDRSRPGPMTAPEAALAKLLSRTRRTPGPDTLAIVGQIAAQGPAPSPPLPPPEIPGLTDLVEVGRGGMGVVYRARETRLDRVVAVKVLTAGAALTPDGRFRAEREAACLTRVVDPHIVQILYVTDVAGAPAIVMEWIDGPSLDEQGAEAIPLADAVALVADVGRGVAALHARGIIHRDIKPANVLLAPAAAGGRPTPKLVDFGLARPGAEGGPAVTRDSVAVGTPSFMAPEQTGLDPALGQVGTAADIHALGGLLYWLISGRAPFDADSTAAALRRAADGDVPALRTLVPGVPADLATIVDKCLARRPEGRYASAAAVVDDLERFRDRRPILARPAGLLERLHKWTRRRPALAALGATSVVAALALAFGTLYHLRRIQVATAALVASHGLVIDAQGQARRSFERLTDAAAERFLVRGTALNAADRDHLRRIRDEYRQWPLQPDRATACRFKAAGLVRVAELFDRLHWLPDALETVRAARECLDDLDTHAAATADDDALRHRAIRLEIALLARTGQLDAAALAAREDVTRLVRRLADDDQAAGPHLAVAWADLGNVEAMAGRHGESLALHRRAVDLLDRLLASNPDDVALATLSLPVYYNAAISPALTDSSVRRARLQRLVTVAGDGIDRFPTGHEELGRGLLLGLQALTHLDLEAGRPDDALAMVRRRSAAAKALLGEMPESEHFFGELVDAACQACACLLTLGRPEEAEADLAAAVALAKGAVAEQPAIATRTRALVNALTAQGALEAGTGRRAEAIATQRQILDLLAPWVDRQEPGREPPPDFLAAAERARGIIASRGEIDRTATE